LVVATLARGERRLIRNGKEPPVVWLAALGCGGGSCFGIGKAAWAMWVPMTALYSIDAVWFRDQAVTGRLLTPWPAVQSPDTESRSKPKEAAALAESPSASTRVANVLEDRATSCASLVRRISQPKGSEAVPRRVIRTAYPSRSGIAQPRPSQPRANCADEGGPAQSHSRLWKYLRL